MPFGDKSKAAKKGEKEAEAYQAKKKQVEDKQWEDNDKKIAAKQDRKQTAAEKEAEKLRKAQEKKELEEADAAAMANVGKKQPQKKVTRAQIASVYTGPPAKPKPKGKASAKVVDQDALNLMAPNRNVNPDDVDATGLDAAVTQLEADAAKGDTKWRAFEAEMTPQVKHENPGLKRNQIQAEVWKRWQRAPENPKNQK
mmetsp:Transcript_21336/g.51715  ORF Transcript_21336/g.51715 Transcript_21336/m.51715 type:complete len:198 (-) Transcript_21336:202-795(-)